MQVARRLKGKKGGSRGARKIETTRKQEEEGKEEARPWKVQKATEKREHHQRSALRVYKHNERYTLDRRKRVRTRRCGPNHLHSLP